MSPKSSADLHNRFCRRIFGVKMVWANFRALPPTPNFRLSAKHKIRFCSALLYKKPIRCEHSLAFFDYLQLGFLQSSRIQLTGKIKLKLLCPIQRNNLASSLGRSFACPFSTQSSKYSNHKFLRITCSVLQAR